MGHRTHGSGPGQETVAPLPASRPAYAANSSFLGFREADRAVSLRLDVPVTELVQRLQNGSMSP